jgi:hypothetical protein
MTSSFELESLNDELPVDAFAGIKIKNGGL